MYILPPSGDMSDVQTRRPGATGSIGPEFGEKEGRVRGTLLFKSTRACHNHLICQSVLSSKETSAWANIIRRSLELS